MPCYFHVDTISLAVILTRAVLGYLMLRCQGLAGSLFICQEQRCLNNCRYNSRCLPGVSSSPRKNVAPQFSPCARCLFHCSRRCCSVGAESEEAGTLSYISQVGCCDIGQAQTSHVPYNLNGIVIDNGRVMAKTWASFPVPCAFMVELYQVTY